jgi:chromosome segregation ATPase
MKKILLLSMTMVLLLTVGCKEKKEKSIDFQSMEQNDSLQKIIAQRDNEINDMMGLMNEIQEGFREISEAENHVSLIKNGEGANQAQQMRESIKFISTRMKQNRELINKLQKQLSQSNFKGEEMTKTVEGMLKQLEEKDKQMQQLRAELDAKNIHITELDETINNLNTDVSDLKEESARKSQTISGQDAQLNTAWYVFGNKKELKEQRILVDGKVLQSSFNKSYFTKIDIRSFKSVKLYSKSAKLLTMHPSSSYNLTRDTNNQYVLNITNPEIFWSTSKYLVIQVR